MFSRYSIAIASLTLASLVSGRPAVALEPLAKKIAEFKENFYPAALAFNGDGTQLAVNFMVGDDGVQVWDWRKSRLIRKLVKVGDAGDGHALGYSPDGKFLAVRHGRTLDGRVIRVWNAETGELVHDLVVGEGKGDPQGMVFSPDGQLLVLSVYGSIREPGDQVFVFRTDTWELAWGLRTAPFHPTRVAFSPDGKLLALGGEEGPGLGTPPKPMILIFDISTRQIVRTIEEPFPGHLSASSLAWSSDGLHLAAGGCAGCGDYRLTGIPPSSETVNIFEVETGTRVASVRGRLSSLDGLAYSPDGKYLIAGSIDNTVRIMDAHSYALLQSIPGDGRSVAFSRDSRYVAISASPKVSVWELK